MVCTGKGKLSAYVFGAINTLLYAIISYKAKFYGEVMLNALEQEEVSCLLLPFNQYLKVILDLSPNAYKPVINSKLGQ